MRIAVCDDNTVMLSKLKEIICADFSVYPDEFDILTYSSGALLLNAHKQEAFQIIFLDIDMPKVSGFDVAKTLRDDFSNCFIIFITSHSELVYESMDFQPFHFIQKNCEISIEESMSRIVKKLMKHMKQYEKVILEDKESGRHAVYIHDIMYIESEKHYLNYYIAGINTPIRERGSIKECEERYERYDFVKIHKRYLINLRYLVDFDGSRNEVTISKIDKKLTMSKNYKKNVDEKYTLYLRSML